MTRSIFLSLVTVSVLLASGGPADAKSGGAEKCINKVLLGTEGDKDTDLEVSGPCDVRAGTHRFRYVNVLANGVLNFLDGGETHFWATSILVENRGTLTAGTPDKPLGTSGGRVTIHLYGAPQGKSGTGVRCKSTPVETCGAPDAIWSSNLDGSHMPTPPAQAVKVNDLAIDATIKAAYPGTKDDYFYGYHPMVHDDGDHQAYFGYKVLAVSYGGTLQLFGRKGAIYPQDNCHHTDPKNTGRSWVRLAETASTDATTIKVETPACGLGWADGDDIVVTTTDYLPGHSEQRKVSGTPVTNADGTTTLTLDQALTYLHNGKRFALDATTNPGIERLGLSSELTGQGAETRAAVGLLSRSIRIVSAGDLLDFPAEGSAECTSGEGPSTNKCYFGAHTVFRQGYKTVQIQGVEFYQMGQGGRLGHYPIHFHHARKTLNPDRPDLDTFVTDSSVWDSMTRWIVLHGTQDVTLARNVGYKSIGHGFYLEDATEINNKLLANLGVFARAAVDNIQNPRKVPGILAAPDLHGTAGENVPYRSDYDHPTVFWIMNGWNDFQYNLAAGAGTCGVCYWLPPGYNSTISKDLKWESYASLQSNSDRGGMTPLKSFIGNACVSAMTSFQTITVTESCQGVGPASPAPTLPAILNPLAANAGDLGYYPSLADGGRFATRCGGATHDPHADCSSKPDRCSANNPDCMVTVLDGYTTSFNWAAFNFAGIWLRPQWYLVTNSVITDAQQAGLTMVTGGGYSGSDVIQGHWALVHKSVFIGNTQDGNAFASNGGPFNPQSGLRCAEDGAGNRPGAYCLSIAEGVSHQMSNFGMYQRLFSVYDGPAFQDSNAYLNVGRREIDDCTPFTDSDAKVGRCDPDFAKGHRQSAWLAGTITGLQKATKTVGGKNVDYCYMPNAAIGWKQPNGFYYPPAFHSTNLFFKDVEIRHFVVTPLFLEGTLTTNTDQTGKQYCNWSAEIFTGFAGNDRQTVLNDDDGTLTGYKNATVINLDDFFAAPVEAIQCRSDDTSRTSPYEYVTTVVYPRCVIDKTCARAPNPPPPHGDGDQHVNDGDWNRACTSEKCYGIPLWRQDLLPVGDLVDPEHPDKGTLPRSIRMMGQETGQRSTLTVNHGTYYLDTTVGRTKQLQCPDCLINIFKPGETYYLFTIFAKESTEQTYRFYVGQGTTFNPAADIKMVQANVGPNPVVFSSPQPLPAGRARWFDQGKGIVEVVVKQADLPDLATKIKTAKKNKCQPATYCTWNDATERCEDANSTTTPKSDEICHWAVADLDCPEGGCYGIVFTLPNGFATDPATDPRPAAVCLPRTIAGNSTPWDVSLDARKVSDGVCPVPADKLLDDFCP